MSKGWFYTPGRPGDRSLEQQKLGLSPLLDYVYGKTILDIGCAEGLLALECLEHGATFVTGIEIVPGHIHIAKEQAFNRRLIKQTNFMVENANTYKPFLQHDVVLMLAILHKLSDPSAAARRFADATKDLCVLRLPPLHAPSIIDLRSGNKPHHIDDVMCAAGFYLEATYKGAFDEWVGYYRRG